MKNVKAIIVDDETRARNVLEKLIARIDPTIEVVARCEDVPEAVEAIRAFDPDVVFLDVQMPNYAGYELIHFLPEINFKIIFVTAFDKYAIRAFEMSALDYLVKPVERIRLKEALEKLKNQLELETISEEHQILMESMQKSKIQKIVIRELSKKHIIDVSNIIAIEALRSYCCIYLFDGDSIVVSRHLKYFETHLEDVDFLFRTQKSWIVNLHHIKCINSNCEIQLSKDIVAKVSKNKQKEFEALLERNNKTQ